jgi:flagellar biosynthesis/type III secretory pathway protein FliH
VAVGAATAGVVLLATGIVVALGALLLSRGGFRARATEGSVARTSPGALLLDVDPPDADVLVDGQRVTAPAGLEPLRLELPPGQHELKVTREGFAPHSQQVTLTAGQPERVTVALTPERPPEVKPPAVQSPRPPPAGGQESAEGDKPNAPRRKPRPGGGTRPRAATGEQPVPEMTPEEQQRQLELRLQQEKDREEAKRREEEAREEAKRKAEEEARKKADAEARQEDAARQLKQARDLVDRIKLARLEQDDRQADKLRERAEQRLQEIVKKYPETQAAVEARELLDKLGR